MEMTIDIRQPFKEEPGQLPRKRLSDLLRQVTRNRFGAELRRQDVQVKHDRLVFCCPYCGDSKDPKKKRGNLYYSTLYFKCYNGGCEVYRDLLGLLSDYGVTTMTESERAAAAEIIGSARDAMHEKRSVRKEVAYDAVLSDELLSVMVPRQRIMEQLSLRDVAEWSPAGNYLVKRCQVLDHRFAWDWKYKRIWIFNMDRNENVLGLQVKPFGENSLSKYKTYGLTDLREKFLKMEKNEVADRYNQISMLFGVLRVDFGNTVTVFEGPLDHFLYPNSVGTSSINNEWPYEMGRFFQDNDKAGRTVAMNLLEQGKSVFMWSKFLSDYQLPSVKIKDYTDVRVYGAARGIEFGTLDEYFSQGLLDGIYV
jgi:hypothetical protein